MGHARRHPGPGLHLLGRKHIERIAQKRDPDLVVGSRPDPEVSLVGAARVTQADRVHDLAGQPCCPRGSGTGGIAATAAVFDECQLGE